MPNIGDLISANNIGTKITKQKRLFVWLACPDCGKERWVRKYYEGKPSSGRCIACGNKYSRDVKVKGMEQHGRWNGGRKIQRGYAYIRLSRDNFFYPLAHKNGYALEHRVIMAIHLNRCLLPWEIVHHKNGIKDDNRIENLELLPHARFHLVDMETKRYIKQLETEVKELKSPKLDRPEREGMIQDDQVLTELWDNDKDAAYDQVRDRPEREKIKEVLRKVIAHTLSDGYNDIEALSKEILAPFDEEEIRKQEMKEIIAFMMKQGSVFVDRSYEVIEAIKKGKHRQALKEGE